MKDFLAQCKPFRGRIFGGAVGLAVAVLWMLIGFWRTLLLVLLVAIGCLAGLYADDKEKCLALVSWVKALFERD